MAFMALAALPSIIQMMQSNQAPPSNPAAQVKMPDMGPYTQMMLNSAFSPQSDLLKIASQQAMGSVNNDLANKGLGFSSYGNQASADAQTKLANAFMQSELQRRISAFNAATGYNVQNANQQMNAANAGYGSAMNQYNAGVNQQQQAAGNIGNIVNTGLGAYNAYNQNNIAQNNQNNQMKMFQQMMAANTAGPTGGYSSGSPGAMSTMNIGGQ